MTLSIIIFCYNEGGTITAVVENALHVCDALTSSYEVIVVDDGSTDNTAQSLKAAFQTNEKVKLLTHPVNQGIGMALRTGYKAAACEFVCAVPGDGQFELKELLQLTPFDNTVFYSFYRTKTDYNFYRAFLSWLNRLFNQHILGIFLRDVNWIKVYRREQLLLVKPELKSSLIESEICAKLYRCGIRPIEIPSSYNKRVYGVAKGGSWATLKKAVSEMVALCMSIWRFDKINM